MSSGCRCRLPPMGCGRSTCMSSSTRAVWYASIRVGRARRPDGPRRRVGIAGLQRHRHRPIPRHPHPSRSLHDGGFPAPQRALPSVSVPASARRSRRSPVPAEAFSKTGGTRFGAMGCPPRRSGRYQGRQRPRGAALRVGARQLARRRRHRARVERTPWWGDRDSRPHPWSCGVQ